MDSQEVFGDSILVADERLESYVWEVIERLPEDVVEEFSDAQAAMMITDSQPGPVLNLFVEAPGSSPVPVTIHVLQPEMHAMPREAALGAVALFLAEDMIGFRKLYAAGEMEGPTDRGEVDGHLAGHALASEWGFDREIEALRAWTDRGAQNA